MYYFPWVFSSALTNFKTPFPAFFFVGTSLEQTLYRNMTIAEFVQRLLTKRCVTFVGFYDTYILISGETGCGLKYLKVGTEEEEEPLTLERVLSYDEIKVTN